MKVFKSLIVEDEPNSVANLQSILDEINFVSNVGHFDTLETAKDAILYEKPDILFLDIVVGSESVFNLLEKLGAWDFNFGIVFITAHYEKYFRDAIETCGLKYRFAYLPKPIESSMLIQKINEIRKGLLSDSGEMERNSLILNFQSGTSRYLFDEIMYCETDGTGANIYFTNEKKDYISKNLTFLNKELPSEYFFKISGQHLINKRFFHKSKIVGIGDNRKYWCILQVGLYEVKLPIPPRQWRAFKEEVSKWAV